MKILITNNHLDNYAGSELVLFEIARELKKKGNYVYVFTFKKGKVAEKLSFEHDILVYDNIYDLANLNPDIIHAQHNTTALIARIMFPSTPMVFMSHGILPELEQPPLIDLGISRYIAISEEVKDNLVKKYSIPDDEIEIIRNFVDTEKFLRKKSVNYNLKKVLVISNHYTDEVKGIVEEACLKLGASVSHIGLPENPIQDVEKHINNSDLVISLGKGTLEGMACERNVIVFDKHGGDGFLDKNNYYEISKNNFSGRRFRKRYSKDDLVRELKKYNPDLGGELRKIVIKENSLKTAIMELENVYNSELKDKNKSVKINADLMMLRKEITGMSKKIEEKEKVINSMENSFFWKLKGIFNKILRIKT